MIINGLVKIDCFHLQVVCMALTKIKLYCKFEQCEYNTQAC